MTINEKRDVDMVEQKEEYELITIGKKDYILIDKNVYTITNDKPDEIYGNYRNGKFSKFNNDKIIVKGKKQKEKTNKKLKAELGM